MRQVSEQLERSDRALLTEYAKAGSEEAFAQIIRRHGAMVLGVCRSVLGSTADAEDAAQAVFITLSRKVATLQTSQTVAPWLHRVARYVALRARQAAVIRRRHELEAARMKMSFRRREAEAHTEQLHDALAKLPEKYRAALLLHHLEGFTEEQTAALLGCSASAVSSRLSRGRELLRRRVARTDSAASVELLIEAAGNEAAPSAAFIESTIKIAGMAAAGKAIAPGVATLYQGALHMLKLAQIKLIAGAAAACVLLGGMTIYLGHAAEMPTAPAVSPQEDRVRAFHAMVAAGSLDEVRAALKEHPDLLESPLSSNDESQRLTPLHTAVDAGQQEMTKLLLEKGAQVDERVNGWTPLMRAAIGGHDEIIKILLKNGGDVNGATNPSDLGDITPIRAAQLHGKTITAQLLLEKGARIDLFSAAGLGWKTYVADRLEENPSLATFKDHWDSQAAWIAVNTGQAAVVEQLVKAGASVEGKFGQQGFSALHIAAERGYTDLAALLLKSGQDVNVRDNEGKTPLDYAAANQQPVMVDWLKGHRGV